MTDQEAWLRWRRLMRRRRLRPETIRLRGLVLRDLWRHLERQGRTWEQVVPEDLDDWLERRCRPGKRSAGQSLRPSSRRVYLAVALCFYRLASERGWLEGANPLVDAVLPSRPPRRPRGLRVAALQQLVAELEGDERLQMMVLLGYHQMLRVGEMVALQVEDIAMDAEPRPMLLVHGKGGRDVWMAVSPQLLPWLRVWLLTRTSGPLLANHRFPGRPLQAAYAARLLARAMRPVVGDSGHALRHTAADQLRRLTRDPFVVRDALRHSGWGDVHTYVGRDDELLADALGRLPDPTAQEETR